MVQIDSPCWEAMPASSSPSSFLSWSAPTPTPMTTSTSMTETVIGSHLFNISGYSHSKGMAIGKYVKSDTFNAGGHSWEIYFYPNGKKAQDNATCVSLFILLASEGTDVRARFELKLLDQSGKERHMVRTQFDSGPYTIRSGCMWGYSHFFKRTALETPDYLKDDCLKVYCRVGVVISFTERPEIYSNVGQNLGHLFETGKGTDVNLKVDGETFADHSEGHSSGPSQRDNEGGSRSRGRRSSWRDNGGGSGSHGTKLSRQSTLTLSRQRAQGPSTPSNEDENNQLGQFLAEQNNQLGQFLAEQNNQLGQFLAKQRELLLGVFFFFLSLFLFFCLFVFLFLGK